ncbi:MAG: hypothetical protein K2L88_03665 [Clostridiales bacterium]|nr:hypothetical protein [Clostridiales bacterium]
MKKKILLSIAKHDADFDDLQKTLAHDADVTVVGLDDYTLEGVDIFIGKNMPEQKLKAADKLKAVFAYKTGVDGFPLEALRDKGIILCNSHVNSEYIAQYAFSLALTITARIAEFDRKMRDGDWDINNPYWKNLFDMKVGIVGYGSIGQAINKVLCDNGIATYTIDRGKTYNGIALVPSLEALCKQTDLLMIALPQTAQTDNMFDAKKFKLLRGKYIVNVGRSNCIDEHALYASLKTNELAGAAIDTWRQKPTSDSPILKPFDEPFDELNNIVLSSHKAMQVHDGHSKYVADTLKNVQLYLSGQTPRNIVDLTKGY